MKAGKAQGFLFPRLKGSTWDHDGPAGYKPVLARWDSPGGNCRSCVSRSCLSGRVCTQTWLAGMMNNVTKLRGIHHWAMEESGRVDLLSIGYQFKEWVVCTQRVDLSHVDLSGIARIQVSFCLIKSITSWGLEYLTNSRYKERSPCATFIQSVAICCSYYGMEVGTCVCSCIWTPGVNLGC